MKRKETYKKFFNNNEEYFKFLEKDNIKILKVEYTQNFKIKVTYAIIK